ncbi:hypothetical protein PBI_KAMPE_34 [Gordonia phage Kampe]|uniref:Uncharacterized protein n=3 Tax=Gordonia phage Orchid TaxID=1838075 RepID=A0A160DHA6_9CAUD|nr:hypothetical protein BH761_gp034 [Gordonia phage Orchid]ANA87268.1 hypothetical protein PBI_PATRICKSTAR_34 [Gordonia phage PatrickStar]ANA87381.1 hypothetical protein PBI_ORCHID_34 [Gordonia phage Orchid]ANA87495.1 hypothetical protein PBI_KAMPE_34 [Gordonia phage Kampe]AXH46486.1 hypothetical protein SEA_ROBINSPARKLES_37 [Gordonia phage RobinSparkles]
MADNVPDTDGTPASTNKALEELYESLSGNSVGTVAWVEDPEGSGLYRMVSTDG